MGEEGTPGILEALGGQRRGGVGGMNPPGAGCQLPPQHQVAVPRGPWSGCGPHPE